MNINNSIETTFSEQEVSKQRMTVNSNNKQINGSFNTQDEEEYTLPKQARISLVHPVELTDEEKAAWKEQLADYEIAQSI